jgi:hypothetical protein
LLREMSRTWAAAIAAFAVLVVGIGVAVGSGSGSGLTRSVVYVTGTTSAPVVWLAPADGGRGRRLGPGSQPLLAPDGSLVVASEASGLVLYPASGGPSRRFFATADATAVAVAFSPDSRYIAVVLASTDPASSAYSGLAVIDTTTFASRVIVHGQIYCASFAPDGSDRIAYGTAPSARLTARVDVGIIQADGSGARRITSDGRSLNPVWGRDGIAFDRERLRTDAEPAYQVWLMASDGSGRRALSALAIPRLREGLVPTAFSDNGRVLLADYEGQDTSQAWVVRLPTGRATPLPAGLVPAAVSRDGARVLADRGGFLNSPDRGVVESLPLDGGRPRVLAVRGAEPSWND